MKSSDYWEQRQVQDAFNVFQRTEDTADQISSLYLRSSRYLSLEADAIFEKYKTKYGLSEAEARRLLDTLQDKTSLDELLQKLQSGDNDESKSELLIQLEAPAYRAMKRDMLQCIPLPAIPYLGFAINVAYRPCLRAIVLTTNLKIWILSQAFKTSVYLKSISCCPTPTSW